MFYGKSRGQNRKYKKLLWWIDKLEPFTNTDKEFEDFGVPCPPWLAKPKTSGKIKTAFCRKWNEKTEEYISRNPDSQVQ